MHINRRLRQQKEIDDENKSLLERINRVNSTVKVSQLEADHKHM